MRSPDEIKVLLEMARAQGCKSVEVDGIRFEVGEQPSASGPVPELKAEEIVKPMSVLDDLSEEEIQYYATPYFDELQKRKAAQKQKLADEALERSG